MGSDAKFFLTGIRSRTRKEIRQKKHLRQCGKELLRLFPVLRKKRKEKNGKKSFIRRWRILNMSPAEGYWPVPELVIELLSTIVLLSPLRKIQETEFWKL